MKKTATALEFYKDLWRSALTSEIRNLFLLVTAFLIVGTIFYHFVEDWGWVDSWYFSVMTLTTVGYGDLAPSTLLSKVFTTIYVFSGLGIMLTFLQSLARQQAKESFLHRILKHTRREEQK